MGSRIITTGEGGHVITTWDGLVHCGVAGLVCSGIAGLVHSGLGGRSSRGDRDSGFNGNGAFPISSGGVALGKMTGDLVADLVVGFRLKDTSSGVVEEG